MVKLQIKKNVPIPERYEPRRLKLIETFMQMAINDCVELSNASTNTANIYHAAQRAGITVTVRKLSNKMLGVWRVK